jgi:hypothetical protein
MSGLLLRMGCFLRFTSLPLWISISVIAFFLPFLIKGLREQAEARKPERALALSVFSLCHFLDHESLWLPSLSFSLRAIIIGAYVSWVSACFPAICLLRGCSPSSQSTTCSWFRRDSLVRSNFGLSLMGPPGYKWEMWIRQHYLLELPRTAPCAKSQLDFQSFFLSVRWPSPRSQASA